MDVQGHVACVISDNGIGMSGTIIKEVGHGIESVCGGVGLGGGDGADGDKHGVVDGTGVEEEHSDKLLDVLNAGGWQGGNVSGGSLNWVEAP